MTKQLRNDLIVLLCGPAVLLATMVLYGIVNLIFSGEGSVIGMVLNLILSLTGLIGLLWLIIGIPAGIILLIVHATKKDK